MKSGVYWEYVCPTCGWFPSLIIENDSPEKSDTVKHHLQNMVDAHNKKHDESKQLHEAFDEAGWVGEDGHAACFAKSKREALSKFKKLMRRDCGESEARELKIDMVGVGYARVATEEDKIENDYEHWVSWSGKPEDKTPYKVYVLNV